MKAEAGDEVTEKPKFFGDRVGIIGDLARVCFIKGHWLRAFFLAYKNRVQCVIGIRVKTRKMLEER